MCIPRTIFFGLLGAFLFVLIGPLNSFTKDDGKSLNSYELPVPPGARARLGSARLRHEDHVCSVAFTSDGKAVVSSGNEGDIRFWEVSTGKQLCALRGLGFCLSSDGKYLAAFQPTFQDTDIPVRLLDLARGTQSWEHVVPGFEPYSFFAGSFSPDSKVLAIGCANGTVRLFDVATGKQLRELAVHRGTKLNGDGNFVKKPTIQVVAFSPDGKTLAAAGDDKTIVLCEAETGRRLLVIDVPKEEPGRDPFGDESKCQALAFSPNGKAVAAAVSNGAVVVWDVATNQTLLCLQEKGAGGGVAFSPDGQLLASGSMVWQFPTGRKHLELRHRRSPNAHEPSVLSVAFSPDGRSLATGGVDRRVRIWDIATGVERLPLAGHDEHVDSLAFSADGCILATAGRENTIRIWDMATLDQQRAFEIEYDKLKEHVAQIVISPDGKTVVAQMDARTIRSWDVASGAQTQTVHLETATPNSLTFSPNGQIVAWSEGIERVTMWDVGQRKKLHTLTPMPARKLHLGGGHSTPIRRLAFSPDGTTLASGAPDETICLWHVATGKQLRNIITSEIGFNCLAFSPDGSLIVTGEGLHYQGSSSGIRKSSLSLYGVTSGKRLFEMKGHEQPVRCVAFSPDGRTIASCSEDETIRVWEVNTGLELLRLEEDENPVHCVAFSPDGKTIASAMGNGTALLWNLAPLDWQAPGGSLPSRLVEELWEHLASKDAARAYRAIWTLSAPSAATATIPFLKKQLEPVAKVESERIRHLIADLDAIQFAVRQKASEELATIVIQAEPELRKALAETKSEEVRSRIEPLLKPLDDWVVKDPETLRTLRAIWVLERIGTPEARAVLETVAQGAPPARVTQDAKAALARLERKK